MNDMVRLIIVQQQKNLRSQFPIIPRDAKILPVPRKATVIIGIRRSGKSTWQHEKMESLLDDGVDAQNICYIDFSDDRLDFLRLEGSDPAEITDTYYGMYPRKHKERVYFFFDELQYVNRWAQFVNRIQTTQLCEVYHRFFSQASFKGDSNRAGGKDIYLGNVSVLVHRISASKREASNNHRYRE